jgi:nucleoside phosphorylase
MGARAIPQLDSSPLTQVGFVAALASEARCLNGLTAHRSSEVASAVAVGGMGVDAAATAARKLIHDGATALVSWGFAGGLDPALTAGALLVPDRILFGQREFHPDRAWREQVCSELRTVAAQQGTLLTSELPVTDIPSKLAAFRDLGARAVDMESAAIADVANAAGLPFLAVRVVLDSASDEIPQSVSKAIDKSSYVRGLRLTAALLTRPHEVFSLARLIARYRCAQRTLELAANEARSSLLGVKC